MKAVDSHAHGLEPFFNMRPVFVAEVTAQIVASSGSWVARAISKKLCIGDIVFLGESGQERRPGVCPAAALASQSFKWIKYYITNKNELIYNSIKKGWRRIAILISYLKDYTDYLIVALLSEDARAWPP
jgi:hypothetical protein